jgi:hypothetical protein
VTQVCPKVRLFGAGVRVRRATKSPLGNRPGMSKRRAARPARRDLPTAPRPSAPSARKPPSARLESSDLERREILTNNNVNNANDDLWVQGNVRVGPWQNSLVRCRKAIEAGDPVELRQSLGLLPDTPFPIISGMLNWLFRQQRATAPMVESRARELKLLDWLAAETKVSTLVIGLGQLQSSGLLPAALALL